MSSFIASVSATLTVQEVLTINISVGKGLDKHSTSSSLNLFPAVPTRKISLQVSVRWGPPVRIISVYLTGILSRKYSAML